MKEKRQKKKTRNKSKKNANPATSHGTDRKSLGEPEQGSTKKKNDNKRLSKWQNKIPPRWEKKGKVENARNRDAEKGIPQHIPKKMANQELSKESELKEGKNEKKRKWDLPR